MIRPTPTVGMVALVIDGREVIVWAYEVAEWCRVLGLVCPTQGEIQRCAGG